MHLIQLDNVEVSYQQRRKARKVVLNDISLRVRKGEFLTVVGPSGCGKSTLLRLILGNQFPTKGMSMVDGQRVEQVTRHCGIVFQKYSVFPNRTVQDNIAFGPLLERTNLPTTIAYQCITWPVRVLWAVVVMVLMLAGRITPFLKPVGPYISERIRNLGRKLSPAVSWVLHFPNPVRWLCDYHSIREDARAEARELIGRIGLDPEVDGKKYPHELSGGMRQRVAIAQALIMKPKILLMDEPFGALDRSTRDDMQMFVLEQAEQYDLTILFVTHSLEEALYLGTRMIGLSQYYSHDGATAYGARIVTDLELGDGAKPMDVKYTAEFAKLKQRVDRDVLKPEIRQHLDEFNLTHQDAWHPTHGFLNATAGGDTSVSE